MSGVARFVKKQWKQKFRFQKKYWKVAAIAVACYFTFGLAAGAMPAAGAAAAGSGAAATGAGVMTTTAAAAGSTGAIAAGTAAGIETVTVTAAAAGGGISAAGAAGAIAGGVAAGSAGGGGVQAAKPVQPQAAEQPPAKTGLIDKAKGAWKDMSFSDKLLLAKTGVDVVSAATAPSPEEEAARNAKWQGAYYGKTADEAAKGQFVTQQTQPQQPPATQRGGPAPRDIVGSGGVSQPVGDAMAPPTTPGQPTAFLAAAPQPKQAAQPEPEQVTNQGGNRDLFAQRAPGVRYLV